MKTIYFDLHMGAAGDMLTAALLELTPDPAQALQELNALGIPGVVYTAAPEYRCGVAGTRVRVAVNGCEEGPDGPAPEDAHTHGHAHMHEHEHTHAHEQEHGHTHEHTHEHAHEHGRTHPADVRRLITSLQLPEQVTADALAVYALLAAAEAEAHGQPVEEIHFHEVGTMDAVADVVAVCSLLRRLAPQKICALSLIHI